jgi:hypothetical protein
MKVEFHISVALCWGKKTKVSNEYEAVWVQGAGLKAVAKCVCPCWKSTPGSPACIIAANLTEILVLLRHSKFIINVKEMRQTPM